MSRFLTAFIDDPSLEAYQNKGGYTGFHAALKLTPKQVTETIKKSGLRGRGGAGFPTGLKWETVTKGETCYIVCNADEGEPGTFKDRLLLEKSPHLILEGMLISAYANGATQGFIYIRGEYPKEALILQNALDEARAANLLGKRIGQSDFSFDIEIYRGGGSYVVGDETALLNSLMGFRGNPWHKPPYPTQSGLWDSPTVVNNVETLSCVALVMQKGADWFVSIGTPESPGPKLFCVSGNVERPGVYEFPMGTTLKEVLDAAGVKGALKAVQIGGTAGPVYGTRSVAPMGETNGAHSLATSDSDNQMDVVDYKLDYAFMKQVGGSLGSGAIIVMNQSISMVDVMDVTMRFFSEESCGKCFPCRYGTRQLEHLSQKISNGEGRAEYLDTMSKTVKTMQKASLCPFGQSVIQPLNGILAYFRPEIESYISHQKFMRGGM